MPAPSRARSIPNVLDSLGQKIASTCPRNRVTRLWAFCCAESDVGPAYSVSEIRVIFGKLFGERVGEALLALLGALGADGVAQQDDSSFALQELAEPLCGQHAAVIVVGGHVADRSSWTRGPSRRSGPGFPWRRRPRPARPGLARRGARARFRRRRRRSRSGRAGSAGRDRLLSAGLAR